MADNSKDEFGGWTDDEDSGFYGEPDEWFDVPKEDGPLKESPAESELQQEVPGGDAAGQESTGEAGSAETADQIHTYHENEPEEELAEWNKSETESTYAEYDPFFDPDLPNIERPELEPEEEEEKEKPGKKLFRNLFASKKEPRQKEPRPKKQNQPHQRKFNKKLLIWIAAGAACAVAAFFIVYALMHAEKPQPEETAPEAAVPQEIIVTESTAVTSVRHLSFARLAASETEGLLSVNEFSQILGNLYENGYVLVDVYSIAAVDEDGNFKLVDNVEVPEGKKPLLISQRDVPDVSAYDAGVFADGLMIGDDGELRSSYTDADGNTAMGDLDVVPVLESFIREHPDFSFAGARGIAAVTGYNGLIGKTQTSAAEVVQKMKERGWRFASNGYKGISYGSEIPLIEEDVAAWDAEVKGIVGETDLLVLPRKTDIASWAPYSPLNEKYALLHKDGFRYFFINTPETPGFLQVEKEYVREAILEIDTYEDYQSALDSGAI